jgi:hypothetical protein
MKGGGGGDALGRFDEDRRSPMLKSHTNGTGGGQGSSRACWSGGAELGCAGKRNFLASAVLTALKLKQCSGGARLW